ncbi:MerR family transcriptional regulator [Candidatus Chrysopegis kryptomonas]|jgi:DNA-binding transcriptional MerR regulator|uniref:MerR HTH family regulatory protein n=1 Tax=Candidatus Chryseopegocella kryptomonas TaxID=1633643 RepID=A0A0P1MKX5_9BACT|nr:MerR family transcriptional regulator [Candidatus Chrysopegis kryptomonas]CUS95868.1 MerR HTH family regulatory protein [Candidatus Chrysopegis kryptomonas]
MPEFKIERLYYSIGEVSKLTGVEPYVLRYWEKEFEQLKPSRSRGKDRAYTNRDIKIVLMIKRLLWEEGYTIEGAKRVLQNYNPDEDATEILDDGKIKVPKITDPELRQCLVDVKKILELILNKL